jgi:hypothetical protein
MSWASVNSSRRSMVSPPFTPRGALRVTRLALQEELVPMRVREDDHGPLAAARVPDPAPANRVRRAGLKRGAASGSRVIVARGAEALLQAPLGLASGQRIACQQLGTASAFLGGNRPVRACVTRVPSTWGDQEGARSGNEGPGRKGERRDTPPRAPTSRRVLDERIAALAARPGPRGRTRPAVGAARPRGRRLRHAGPRPRGLSPTRPWTRAPAARPGSPAAPRARPAGARRSARRPTTGRSRSPPRGRRPWRPRPPSRACAPSAARS